MSYPTAPTFNSLTISSNITFVRSEAVNLRTQTRSLGGQRWEIAAGYAPMRAATFMPIWTYITANQANDFAIILPRFSGQFSTASGAIVVSSTAPAGASTVAISGVVGTLKAGDYIKFRYHNKCYLITEDRAGDGNLSVFPPLRISAVSGQALIYENVPMQVALKNPAMINYSHSLNKTVQYKIELIEAM